MSTVECLVCGHVGTAKTKGSFVITIILLFIGLLPGLIYEVWRRSGGKVCSACGSQSVKLYIPVQRVIQQPIIHDVDVAPVDVYNKTKLVANDAFSYQAMQKQHGILSDDDLRKQELRKRNQAFINKNKKSGFNFAKLLFISFALVLGLALGLAANTDNSNETGVSKSTNVEPEKEAKEASQKQQLEIGKQQRSSMVAIQTDSRIALKNYLKDPDSAEIRNHNGNCGEVNSKNSFGGYTGFKRFIASPAIVAIDGENISSEEFQEAWNQVCK